MPEDASKPASNKRKLIAAGLVLALALIVFLGWRAWSTYQDLGQETETLGQRIREAQRKVKVDIPKARAQLAAAEEEQDRFRYRDRLPDEDRLEELFDQLSDFERSANVEWLESLSKEARNTRRTQGAASYERLEYTLELTGGFFEFCRFINLIETMPRFAKVESFTIKRSGKATAEANQRPKCDLKLVFSVFRMKAPAPAPAGPGRRESAPLDTARS